MKMSLNVPNNKKCLGVVRNSCCSFLQSVIPDEEKSKIDDLIIVLGELCANAIIHARTDYQVTIEWDGSKVSITVEDNGTGFDPNQPVTPGFRFDESLMEDRFGGMGLFIVRSTTDRMEFLRHDHTGTCVRVEKNLTIN